jgi:hypothetical protein
MTATSRWFGPIRQVAWVVADLDHTIANWIDRAGVGPWTVFRGAEIEGMLGATRTTVALDVGFSYQGDLQIELIHLRSTTPSPYQRPDGSPLVGLHHIAAHSLDLEADLAQAAARGLEVEFRTSTPEVRSAYLNDPQEPGWRLEIIEAEPAIFAGFTAAGAAAAGWDGFTNPVIELTPS